MVDAVKAWKRDAIGRFIEMNAGEQKPYSIDWTEFLSAHPGDTIASVVWTIPAPLILLAQAIAGNVSQMRLSAPVAGVVMCSVTMTSQYPVVEIEPFRVIVT